MRVLIWMVGGDKIPGGHRIQVEQTCNYLQSLGINAHVSFEKTPALDGYDLVHGFGLNPIEIRRCRQHGLPVILSTIYCSRKFYMGRHIPDGWLAEWRYRGRMGLVLLYSALQGRHVEKCEAFVERSQNMRTAYEMADLLLPNSELEADTIQGELGVTTPYQVVPNAVDPNSFFLVTNPAPKPRDGVLYVGRFEPHKNQMGLIKALRGSTIPLVLVGAPHPDHMIYYEQCQRHSGGNISILPEMPHDELPTLYQSAKVHVLPSWFETTGLTSLEAALCGCNIVTTSRGYAPEYFGDLAWYCDPAAPNSIRQAVEAAYIAPFQDRLRERILSHFTWEHTAHATVKGYQRVLVNSGHGSKI